jgi:hypothetical protein
MSSDAPACTTCGTLGPVEYGYSKYGRPEDTEPLPDAAYHLVVSGLSKKQHIWLVPAV